MNPNPHLRASKTAVLLLNLGTPSAPTSKAVRAYLTEFLSDPRVVEIPRIIWWCILNGIILPIRSSASAKKYASIWLSKLGSPLMHYSRLQAKELGEKFANEGHAVLVDLAMRYGQPSTQVVLEGLKAQGMERLLLLPLYPQYSATTTASSFDEVFRILSTWRDQPELRLVKHYHDNPAYIAALRDQVLSSWDKDGRPDFAKGDRFVMSFHGLPKRNLMKGDPYHCECLKTGRLLGESLGLEPGQYIVTFQSRFGKAEWLKPYTAPTIEKLAKEGCQRIDIFCPGFPADCLETLEEIAMEAREIFLEHGGKDYRYIPCLNSSPKWIEALSDIAHHHLQGWSLGVESDAELAKRNERAELAERMKS
ncbi:ferrochelatase [Polynucleobacter sp. AP-RePozz3-80-G7]|uniref:ferrochelatase n=1 Tax=Polynucleobacter sp. AP-RePozz3-80-G7 TaxID=2689105 RepID=UPI001C0AA001|nr:ferrochelatase [Polynucleobacter sp. AP-RePozz3-80-G7]MBU3639685.1 ferrochelatase [Polynucleobacter sp. AP-RePozz3-80-G7]